MNKPKSEIRVVEFTDLSPEAKKDIDLFNQAIAKAIEYFSQVYGVPKRCWINPHDALDGVEVISGLKVERRGGCPRGKIMVL